MTRPTDKKEREGGVRRHFRSNLSIIFTKKEKKIIAFETHLIISQERLNSIIYLGFTCRWNKSKVKKKTKNKEHEKNILPTNQNVYFTKNKWMESSMYYEMNPSK